MKVLKTMFATAALSFLAGCDTLQPVDATAAAPATVAVAVSTAAPAAEVAAVKTPQTMNDIGIGYVKLVLALGLTDLDYVDAYYGPEAWRDEVKQHPLTPMQIQIEALNLLDVIDEVATPPGGATPALLSLRKQYLKTQLTSLIARAQLLQGKKFTFDEEARALYNTDAPHYTDAQFELVLKRLDKLLPRGKGTLADRYNRYLERYSIPQAKLAEVMQTAIGAARASTGRHLKLPDGENFELSLVSDKPWSAYNWYQGKFISRIEVNTALPVAASRVLDLAAHEGYPGHHVYNSLLEARLVNELQWPEFQVYALFSPQSLIAEGSADYGVGLAFPAAEKLALTRSIFKLAGFDPKQADTYLKIIGATHELAPAGIEAARRYLDGATSLEQTVAWLQQYTLASPERAKQRIAFFDKYRAYVINYSWGEKIVRDYVEATGDSIPGSDKQWQAFTELLSAPYTPTGLAVSALR